MRNVMALQSKGRHYEWYYRAGNLQGGIRWAKFRRPRTLINFGCCSSTCNFGERTSSGLLMKGNNNNEGNKEIIGALRRRR